MRLIWIARVWQLNRFFSGFLPFMVPRIDSGETFPLAFGYNTNRFPATHLDEPNEAVEKPLGAVRGVNTGVRSPFPRRN